LLNTKLYYARMKVYNTYGWMSHELPEPQFSRAFNFENYMFKRPNIREISNTLFSLDVWDFCFFSLPLVVFCCLLVKCF